MVGPRLAPFDVLECLTVGVIADEDDVAVYQEYLTSAKRTRASGNGERKPLIIASFAEDAERLNVPLFATAVRQHVDVMRVERHFRFSHDRLSLRSQ